MVLGVAGAIALAVPATLVYARGGPGGGGGGGGPGGGGTGTGGGGSGGGGGGSTGGGGGGGSAGGGGSGGKSSGGGIGKGGKLGGSTGGVGTKPPLKANTGNAKGRADYLEVLQREEADDVRAEFLANASLEIIRVLRAAERGE